MDRQRFLELIEPALKLVASKGEDYNANAIQLVEYFPFKDKSYQQMLHMKVLRMRSLLDRDTAPNHDSLLDSVYDLVNYAVFYLDYLEGVGTMPLDEASLLARKHLDAVNQVAGISSMTEAAMSTLSKPWRR